METTPLTPYPGHDSNLPTLTPAEERLCDFTAPFNCHGKPDAYFEESLALVRTIKTRPAEVIDKLNLYLHYAKGELMRCEISQEIRKARNSDPQDGRKRIEQIHENREEE